MKFKNIFITALLALLVSCAHEEYHVGPVIGIKTREINKALESHIPKFRKCFQSESDVKKEPLEYRGDITFNFTVNEEGKVSKSELETSNTQTDYAKGCLKNILDRIKFPAPVNAKSYDVKKAMNFYPKHM